MDIEEEPLLPLVRNRKTKPVQNVKIQRAAHFEDLKKNNEELNNALPYGGKVYLKRQKKPDHYYVIIFEVRIKATAKKKCLAISITTH